VRLLETEGRDSAAYASNSAVSYHILGPTIRSRMEHDTPRPHPEKRYLAGATVAEMAIARHNDACDNTCPCRFIRIDLE